MGFTDLPLELRQAIYLIATPSRVVHVEEVLEDFAAFEERFDPLSTEIQTHPGLDYFAEHFRPLLNGTFTPRITFPNGEAPHIYRGRPHLRQRKLENYGFKSNKNPIIAWRYEDDMPLDVLCHNPRLAFQLFRHGRLKHAGPIPPLLHVSFESRVFLISQGYELTFGTRSHVPSIWFNFKRDVLTINHALIARPSNKPWRYVDGEEFHGLLSGSHYHVGQFLPSDLKRVTRLAFEGWFPETHRYCALDIRPVVHLFPQVRKIFGISWMVEQCIRALEEAVLNLDPGWDPEVARCERQTSHRFVSVEEIDTLWTRTDIDYLEAFCHDYDDDGIRALGLKCFKLRNGFSVPFIDEQPLDCSRHNSRIKCIYPEIKFRHVHMVTETIGQMILMHRESFMKYFQLLKQQAGVPLQLKNDGRVDLYDSSSSWVSIYGRLDKTHQEEVEWWVQKGCPANSNTWRSFLDL